jgi:hypothetical protein
MPKFNLVIREDPKQEKTVDVNFYLQKNPGGTVSVMVKNTYSQNTPWAVFTFSLDGTVSKNISYHTHANPNQFFQYDENQRIVVKDGY